MGHRFWRIAVLCCCIALLTLPLAAEASFLSLPEKAQPAARQTTIGQIVFNSDRDGDHELYIMASDGSGVQQLTFDSFPQKNPELSPDGTTIVYTDAAQGTWKIGLIGSSGSGGRVLTSGAQTDDNPSWHPAGGEIYFESDRDGDRDLYHLIPESGQITQALNNPGADTFPTWEWTSMCMQVIFQSDRSGTNDLYWKCAYDDSDLVGVQLTYGANAAAPDLSKDGTRVVYQAAPPGQGWDIYVLNLLTASPAQRLTWGEGGNYVPQWSPDGTQIAFVSDRDGDNEIFVINADGSNLRQITFNSASDEFPSWGPFMSAAPAAAPPTTAPVSAPVSSSGGGPVIFSDDFSSPASGWSENDFANADGFNSTHYRDGALRIELGNYMTHSGINMWIFGSMTQLMAVPNLSLEVDVTLLTAVGQPGVVFRAGPDRFFWFRIDPAQQQYTLVLDYRNGSYKDLIPTTYSAAIRAGSQTNRLGVIANGSTITVLANGQVLGQVSESSYLDGGDIGLWLSVPQAPAGGTTAMTVLYDNLVVSLPGSQDIAPPVQPAEAAQPVPANPAACAAVSADGGNANVRSGPGVDYGVLGMISGGLSLPVTGYNGDWYAVDYFGTQGWQANWVVSLSGSCANLAFLAPGGAVPGDTGQPEPTVPPASLPATIQFTVNQADHTTMTEGECVTVAWNVADAVEVYYQDQPVGATDSRMECPTQSTEYHLWAMGKDGSAVERWVSVTVVPLDVPEPTEAPETPTYTTGYDTLNAAALDSTHDLHFWRFAGLAGQIITVDLISTSGGYDPIMDLQYETDGQWHLQAQDNDSGGNLNARITDFMLPHNGTYVVRVYGVDRSVGGYNLIISLNVADAGSESNVNPEPAPADSDGDGMSDETETMLINGFSPVLIFDDDESNCIGDPASHTAAIYQVTPYQAPGRYGAPGAIITVTILYPRDCGGLHLDWVDVDLVQEHIVHSHEGDSEALRIYVTNDVLLSDGSMGWMVNTILMMRHFDPWEAYDPDDFDWRPTPGSSANTHPVVWVSWSKHAMYSSHSECDDFGLVDVPFVPIDDFEYCDGDTEVRLYTPFEHNVGERNNRRFDVLADSGPASTSMLAALFWPEHAWSDVDFCGGYVSEDCAGALNGKWWPPQDPEKLAEQTELLLTEFD